MADLLTFKHSGNIGDVIYSLPALQGALRKKGIEKAVYYLNPNMRMGYTGPHPLGNVLLNDKYIEMAKPLLESQPYIERVETYTNQNVHVDFDNFRRVPLNPFTGCIPRWYFWIVIGATWDLTVPWLHVGASERFRDKILVSRNPRLQSQFIKYDFMNQYSDEIVFVGVRSEFDEFRKSCPNCKEFYEAPDFLNLAMFINGCRFTVANQGLIYTLSEAMKTPRLLESNNKAANNIPMGGEAYDALFQQGFEYWFNYLRNR